MEYSLPSDRMAITMTIVEQERLWTVAVWDYVPEVRKPWGQMPTIKAKGADPSLEEAVAEALTNLKSQRDLLIYTTKQGETP